MDYIYRPFETGFICGRFQHFHIGHMKIVDTALATCDKVLVMVGSAQEQGTVRNPFDDIYRIGMIALCYPEEVMSGRLLIRSLPDMTHEDDINHDWGRYVLAHATSYLGKSPELMAYGNDENRRGWFAPEDIEGMTEIILPRKAIPIEATELRVFIALNNFFEWRKYVPLALHQHFGDIRERLMKIDYYKEVFDDYVKR